MLTDIELKEARVIVAGALKLYNNDRDKTIEHIQDICRSNPELQVLFAKVGYELFSASQSVKH